jgi:hypothetical protein
MIYFVITTKDDTLQITAEEHKKLAGASGVVFIPSLGEMLNLSFIYRIIPEDKFLNYLQDKRLKITSGRLNDGTKVFKNFGQWKDLRNPEAVLDPHYYPEVANDSVMSEEEYFYREKNRLLAIEGGETKKRIPKNSVGFSKPFDGKR